VVAPACLQRGLCVLSLNYRGSTGFGNRFYRLGVRSGRLLPSLILHPPPYLISLLPSRFRGGTPLSPPVVRARTRLHVCVRVRACACVYLCPCLRPCACVCVLVPVPCARALCLCVCQMGNVKGMHEDVEDTRK
jgi:hypothetical protein